MTETQKETQTVSEKEELKEEEHAGHQGNENAEQAAELTELLKRTQANFENYRKQTEKRVEELREMATKHIILQILPVLDNLQLALKHAPQAVGSGQSVVGSTAEKQQLTADLVEGLVLVAAQFTEILQRNGVEEISTEKQMLNPHLHEALAKVNSALPENTIVEEVQKGYTLHEQVIRHAKVKVSTGTKSQAPSTTFQTET